MKQDEILHGFVVRSVQKLTEQKATLYQLEYVKNGAELIWFDNGENNKLFSIAFKTLPSDDTGVFHILEHSVLCGSKKYPVKEPFLDLLKSSMNTFLNALTFSDKTLFPVSSRNETDFLNLMQVYLDAVFCPAIYDNPSIFHQEGWHYELNDEAADPVYKGVVFNEMKGAFSSVNTLLEHGMNRLLFPDNCYRFVSGGDPKKIPTLTYEQFIQAHKEYYHPSNAKIYLDGNVPFERVLTILDEEYLSNYDRADIRHEIEMQQPVSSAESVEYYEIGEEADSAEKVQMGLGKLVCDFSDRKKIMALMALSSYLTGSNEAPLKQAILQNGLGQDISLSVMDGIAQSYCLIQVSNTEYENRNEIKKVIKETAERILSCGLDKDELEAVINQLEFGVREGEEPQGLTRNINALKSWLYGGSPDLYLIHDELFRSLREAVNTEYYENLLRDILLDSEHTAEIYFLPSKTKGEEDLQAECNELAYKKASWSETDIRAVIEANRKLQAWQCAPDTPEALETLPTLSLNEVNPLPTQLTTKHSMLKGAPVLFHELGDSGVVHFNLYFSLADCPLEKLGNVSFMTKLLGLLPTKRHSVSKLQREIKRNIGFLDYNIVSFAVPGHTDRCKPYFSVNCSVLKNRMQEAVSLLIEILSETVFEGEQSALLIREILLQRNEVVHQEIKENGHLFAIMRALAHSAANCMVKEQAAGYAFYCYLVQFAADFEQHIKEFQAYAQSVQESVFSTDRMTLSITSDEICTEFEDLAEKMKKEKASSAPEYMTVNAIGERTQEIIQIPAGVSYAVSAGNLQRYEMRYTGALRVLATILSYDYLWNEVRVQGGAYGCGFEAGVAGSIFFYSYRDPNPICSIRIYQNAAEFVRTFCDSEVSLDKYIISTIAATEPLESPREQGLRADTDEFSGISFEDRVRIRAEMLHTKKEDILSLCDLFEKMATENALCITGNADAVKECKEQWKVFNLYLIEATNVG